MSEFRFYPIVLILAAALSGCGDDNAPSSRPTAAASTVPAAHSPDTASIDADSIDNYPLLSLEQLLAPAQYTAPQISPDGQLISYIAPFNGVPNLYVAPADDITQARALTRFTDSGVRATDVSGQVMYRWHYDSQHILYPKDYGGNEHWDIHLVDVANGEDRNLTPSPDQSVEVIAYGRAKPDQALITVETFGTGQPDVYLLDFISGESRLVQANDGALNYSADNDLNIRFRVQFAADGGLEFLKPDGHEGWTQVYRVAPGDTPALSTSVYQKIIRYDAHNENIFLYDAHGRDTAALVKLNADSGAMEVIAADERVDIGGVIYHPLSNQPQGYATNWTRVNWHAIDPAIAPDLKALSTISEGDWEITSRSDQDDKWIVRYMLSDEPITFYLYDRSTKSGTKLFTSTPQLEGLKLSKMHPYVLTTDDGFDLVSYITLPPWTDPDEDGRPDHPVPVVVMVHGGPSDERALFAFGPTVHWLANRGYAFQYVNFRGSAGFGKAYMNAQTREWGGKMHQDVLDQVQWAIDEGIADPDRVAIFGGSYGGYEALVAMTMTPDVFACGIAVVGPSNLEIFMPHWDPDRMGKVIGDPRTEEGRAFLRSRSPINFAQNTKHPVLIGQGANDSRVPKLQSDIVVDKMMKAGVEVTYALFPDEGHGFQRPANSRAFNAVTENFLGQCLGGRSQPITDQLEGSSLQVPVGAEHIPGLVDALARGDGTE